MIHNWWINNGPSDKISYRLALTMTSTALVIVLWALFLNIAAMINGG